MMTLNRSGYLESPSHRECTRCGVTFEKTSKMTLCKRCNCQRVKSQTPEWKMFQRAKTRAKEKGIEFDLDMSDIVIPDTCPIMGIALNVNSGRSGAYSNSPSLDRLNNDQGYIKGNVWVISQLANAMKGKATVEQLQKFAQWINVAYPIPGEA